MVTSMDLMKPSPLLRGEWAENGMVEQAGVGPEPLLGVRQRRVHGDQCVAKAA